MIYQVNLLDQNDSNLNFVTDCNDLYWSNPSHLSGYGEKYFSKKFVNMLNDL